MKLKLRYKGGSGSGNYGHSGRPGLVGGSESGTSKYAKFKDYRQLGQAIEIGSVDVSELKWTPDKNEGYWSSYINGIGISLRATTHTSYKTSGRLRMPSGTNRSININISTYDKNHPLDSYPVSIYHKNVAGEGSQSDERYYKAVTSAKKLFIKKFGFDPGMSLWAPEGS